MIFFKRELTIYFAVLICLAGIWHNASLIDNIQKIHLASNPFHPLEWAMVVYLVLWIPRAIYYGIKKLVLKGKHSDNPGN